MKHLHTRSRAKLGSCAWEEGGIEPCGSNVLTAMLSWTRLVGKCGCSRGVKPGHSGGHLHVLIEDFEYMYENRAG